MLIILNDITYINRSIKNINDIHDNGTKKNTFFVA